MPGGRTLYPDRDTTPRGTVYLIHFDRPLGYAQHYIGFTTDLASRIHEHIKSRGSALIAAVNAEGINWTLACVWEDVTRRKEYELKNWAKAKGFCPICRAAIGVTGKMVRIRGPKGHFQGSRRA